MCFDVMFLQIANRYTVPLDLNGASIRLAESSLDLSVRINFGQNHIAKISLDVQD